MKILYVTTVGSTMDFFNVFIKNLIDEGNEVHIATNQNTSKVPDCYENWGCKIYPLSCTRSPLNMGNIKAIKQIKKIVEENSYDIVHCHTPIAAMCTRFACVKARKKGTKVIYTAHGFHFFKGAPMLNWLIYFPVEWICSFLTDTLITINSEDYNFAKKKLHTKTTKYVHGVGADTGKFSNPKDKCNELFDELDIPESAKVLFSVGELNKNKNHQIIIKALSEINDTNIYYLVAGIGEMDHQLLQIAEELGIKDRIKLLGYRNDISNLLMISDIFCFPSFREGLPVSVMEAMASGLPVVASNIRGNVDLIDNEKGGFLCSPEDTCAFKDSIKILLEDEHLRRKFGRYNKEKVEIFSLDNVKNEMIEIYEIKN